MPITHRDYSWPLPDRPDHPFYLELYREIVEGGDYALYREACLNDFYFFIRYCLSLGQLRCDDPYLKRWYGRPWFDHPWLFERTREVQERPDGMLDLWPRFHFKTAIITQSLPLWELCDQPDLRYLIITEKEEDVGESFLALMKRECEENELLKTHFPGTFWQNPKREAPVWTNEKLAMRQTLNPKEPTLALASLKAGKTGYHVHRRHWDDIVNEWSTRSRQAIEDTTQSFRNFSGTAADYVADRFTGTHWAVNDTYRVLLDEGLVQLRYHDVFEDDEETPVLRSKEWVESRRLEMGADHFACVMRNRPMLAGDQTFDLKWLRYYEELPEQKRQNLNVYIIIDTARAQKKDSDYTVIWVIGLGAGVPFGYYYALDMVRDRMGLVRFTETVFDLVEKWRPLYVIMEQTGAARDDEHLAAEMARRNTRFRILEHHEKIPKADRIRRLQAPFEAGRIYFPSTGIMGSTDGRRMDVLHHWKEKEYAFWTPTGGTDFDDGLDCLAVLTSPKLKDVLRFPLGRLSSSQQPEGTYRGESRRRRSELDGDDVAAAWAI